VSDHDAALAGGTNVDKNPIAVAARRPAEPHSHWCCEPSDCRRGLLAPTTVASSASVRFLTSKRSHGRRVGEAMALNTLTTSAVVSLVLEAVVSGWCRVC
jgi:hypothetical protein